MNSWRFREGDLIAPGLHAVRLLGGGHRYEAYLTWDDPMRTLVVAKLLRPAEAGNAQANAALAREAQLLDRLAHPHLVRSFGASLEGERPHLILELVEGPRLSTLIRRFGVVLEQALPLALNLCLGAPLPDSQGGGAPRRQAAQHHHGRSSPSDRPERGPRAPRAR